jgi:hypothetical protein
MSSDLFNLAELIVAAERKEKTLLHGGNEVAICVARTRIV